MGKWIIESLKIIEKINKTRLVCSITGLKDDPVSIYISVPSEYSAYLTEEVADPFVLQLLQYAMRYNCDIESKVPITSDLFYVLTKEIIPTLHKHVRFNDEAYYSAIKITAPLFYERIEKKISCVGTGCSLGVDSSSVIDKFIKTENINYKLTHLVRTNYYSEYRDEQKEYTDSLAKELHLPIIYFEGNILSIFNDMGMRWNSNFHSYSLMSVILATRKMWSKYYIAPEIDLGYIDIRQPSHCISLLAGWLSSDVKFIEASAYEDRVDRTIQISNNPTFYNHINPCFHGINKYKTTRNCSFCSKCIRTMVTLDCVGSLGKFKNVFDVDRYYSNLDKYLYAVLDVFGDDYLESIVPLIKNKYPDRYDSALKHKKYSSFREYLISLDGDSQAIYQLSMMYRDGIGVEKNLKKYSELLLIAEQMGYEDAKIDSAVYRINNGEFSNMSFLLNKSNETNNGWIYDIVSKGLMGEGLRSCKDADGALLYAIKAIDAGVPDSFYRILDNIMLHDDGLFDEYSDRIKSTILEHLDNPKIYVRYAKMLLKGTLVNKNVSKAMEIYSKYYDCGIEWAYVDYIKLLLTGDKKDVERAEQMLINMKEWNKDVANTILAKCYSNKNSQLYDIGSSIEIYRDLALSGNMKAIVNLFDVMWECKNKQYDQKAIMLIMPLLLL